MLLVAGAATLIAPTAALADDASSQEISVVIDQVSEALTSSDSRNARAELSRVRQFFLDNPSLNVGTMEDVREEDKPVQLLLAADLDLRMGRETLAREKIEIVRSRLTRALALARDREQGIAELHESTGGTLAILEKIGIFDHDYRGENEALRRRYPNLSDSELADKLIRDAALKNGLVGAVAAIPGLIPGLGTGARIAALLPEFYFVLREQAQLVFRIADLYGYTLDTQEKVTELLLVMGTSAGIANAAEAVETYLEMKAAKALLSPAGAALITNVLARVGLKISGEAVAGIAAKAVPIIGIATSFGFDWASTRYIGKAAKEFYERRKDLEQEDADRALELSSVRIPELGALWASTARDGLTDEELEMLRTIAAERGAGDADGVRNDLMEASRVGDDLLDELASRSRGVRESILSDLLRVQLADGTRSVQELAAFREMATRLGFDSTEDETRRRLEALEHALREAGMGRSELGARGALEILDGD